MPLICVDMFEGRTLERIRLLVQRLTEAFTSVTGARSESVQTIFAEVVKENWKYAGKLRSDKNPWSPAPADTIKV